MVTLATSDLRASGDYLVSAFAAALVHGVVIAALLSMLPVKGVLRSLEPGFEMVALARPAIVEPEPEPIPEPPAPVAPPEPEPVADVVPETPRKPAPPVQPRARRTEAKQIPTAATIAPAPAPVAVREAPERYTPPDGNIAYLHNPLPNYPRSARRRRLEGTVLLFVCVDREGAPTRVSVRTSSGFDSLDRAALEAVNRWRFEPARRNGVATAGEVLVPVEFRLEAG